MADQLVSRLSRGGLDERLVRELVDVMADVQLRRLKGFPLGTIDPDGIRLHTSVDPDELQGILSLLLKTPRIDGLRVFPKGIIDPEVFEVIIDLR